MNEYDNFPRCEFQEGIFYIPGLGRNVKCRLKYEVTHFRDNLFRWFLVHIEILE